MMSPLSVVSRLISYGMPVNMLSAFHAVSRSFATTKVPRSKNAVNFLAAASGKPPQPLQGLKVTQSSPEQTSEVLKGARFIKNGKWGASITVNGSKLNLGTFETAKEASDAYFAAKAVYSSQQFQGRRKKKTADVKVEEKKDINAERDPMFGTNSVSGGAADVLDVESSELVGGESSSGEDEEEMVNEVNSGATTLLRRESSKYIGVIQEGVGATLWEAVISLPSNKEISGGEYETEEEAAKAYDALARMYLGESAKTNFPLDPYTSWVPPDTVLNTPQIAVKPGELLTLEEITNALTLERGKDIKVIDLQGKSELAQHLVLVTGTSVAHMRRLADTIARALRKRNIPGVRASVEARDMDDWMVVDCSNIIVSIMDDNAREVFDLEGLYEKLSNGNDPYQGMTYEQWLIANPVPEKWLARLAKDEEDIAREQRVPFASPMK
jgi:ribosome-associated protein